MDTKAEMSNSLPLNLSDLPQSNKEKNVVGNGKGDHLTLPVSKVLHRYDETVKLENKVLQAFKLSVEKEEQAMEKTTEVFKHLAFFAQNPPAKLDETQVDLSDVSSLNDTVFEMIRPLCTATLYRNTEINRIESIVDKFQKKFKSCKVADKTELLNLLNDANRCIVAENRAKRKHDKILLSIYPQNPLPGSIPKRLGSFSPRSLTRNAKELEWKESVQQAKVQESKRLKRKAVNEVRNKLLKINQDRCKDLYQILRNYFDIELIYHSKALEQFTFAYQILLKWRKSLKLDIGKNIGTEDNKSKSATDININIERPENPMQRLPLSPLCLAKYLRRSDESLNEQSDSLDLDVVLKELRSLETPLPT